MEESSDINRVLDSLIPFIKENKDVAKLTTYMGKRILESGDPRRLLLLKSPRGGKGKVLLGPGV